MRCHVVALGLLLSHGADVCAQLPAPPHVVLILADDLGIGDLGCYNAESRVPTPRLDRIAAEGMALLDMHSPSGVCTPTRYGVLTGRYCWRSRLKRGVLQGYSPALIEADRVTLASLLRERGYATACIGKWHLGLGSGKRTDYAEPLRPGPVTVGFDHFFGIPASLDMVPYVFVEDDRVVEAPTAKVEKSGHRRQDGGGFWRGGATAPSFRHADVLPVLAERAEAWIDQHAGGDKPLFLYMPLSAPHTPWLPSEEFQGKSSAGYYGDFVAMVDSVVGRVDDALQRAGIRDDTLLLVTSDNGAHWPRADIARYGHRANGPYRGQKADIWEGGHRVPFLARWPGRIAPGSSDAETGCLTDLLATIAAAVGGEVPDGAGEDSFDLLPVLLGEDRDGPIREATVHHSMSGMFAIRQGKWKLIVGRGSGGFTKPRQVRVEQLAEGDPRGQLYDLDEDPAESKNLWNEEPEVVSRLSALLAKCRAE